ncbi:MAG: hypothetical protein Q7V57_08085 [Actinomycetota bacterium]|nr:hypothetical protein [Actinomycetota bacterium]
MPNTSMQQTSTATSAKEARRRSGLVRQAFRFVVLNLKILRLTRQHH